ncbi:hypothetical protein RCG17_02840 [Neobacillus sp. PS3-12]|nr:hypothetical protein [Neobacillus sp. PS3-12]WML53632.1 hypothetical protein RCG17_02840 [Neobacillus sp. PS3-12]
MEENSIHYDGSFPINFDSVPNEPFVLTDEMRSNISGNPYTFEINK